MTKKISFVLWAVLALMLSSCAKSAYKSVIPADALVVAEMDMKSIALKSDLMDKKDDIADVLNLLAGDDAESRKQMRYLMDGLENGAVDFLSPMYAFMRVDGDEPEGFILVSVKDKDAMLKTLNDLDFVEVDKRSDFNWISENNQLVGVVTDKLMLLGSLQDRETYERMLKREAAESFFASDCGKLMAKHSGDITMAINFSGLTKSQVMLAVSNLMRRGLLTQDMIDSYYDQLKDMKLVANLEFMEGSAALNLFADGNASDDFEKVFEKKISEEALSYISSSDLVGFAAMSITCKNLEEEIDEAVDAVGLEQGEQAQTVLNQVKDFATSLDGTMCIALNSANVFRGEPDVFAMFPVSKQKTESLCNSFGEVGIPLEGNAKYTAISSQRSYEFKPAASSAKQINEATGCYMYAYANLGDIVNQLYENEKPYISDSDKASFDATFKLLRLADYAELKMSKPNEVSLELKLTDNSQNILKILLDNGLDLVRLSYVR